MSDPTRREFLKRTTLFAAGAVASGAASGSAAAADAPPTAAPAKAAPNSDPVILGFIGVGGQGMNLLRSFAAMKDVRIPYVCDVDPRRAADAAREVQVLANTEPKVESDLRRVLDDKSVQAVVIATPDHWHAPATILAC